MYRWFVSSEVSHGVVNSGYHVPRSGVGSSARGLKPEGSSVEWSFFVGFEDLTTAKSRTVQDASPAPDSSEDRCAVGAAIILLRSQSMPCLRKKFTDTLA